MKPGRALAACVGLVAAYVALNIATATWFNRFDDSHTRAVRDLSYLPEEKIDILVLGDSTAAFNVSAATLPRAASLALLSGTAVEATFAYRKFLSIRPAPRCVVVGLSLLAPAYEKLFWSQFVRNDFYTLGELGEIYAAGAEEGDFPAATEGRLGFFARALLYRWRLAGLSLAGVRVALLSARNVPGDRALDLERLRAARGPTAPENPDDLAGVTGVDLRPSAPRLTARYTRELFRILRESGVKIFVLPPLVAAPELSAREAELAHHRSELAALAGSPEPTWLRPPAFSPRSFVKPGHLAASAARTLTSGIAPALAGCSGVP